MNRLAILACFGALFSCALEPSFAGDAPTVMVPTSPVVKITFDGGWCSAFYIGAGELVTAGHCLFETGGVVPEKYTVVPDQGASFDAVPLFAASTDAGAIGDYMVLTTTDAPAGWKGATLDCHYTPKLGDALSTFGYPGNVGDGPILSRGYVSGLPRLLAGAWGTPVLMADLPIYAGHSGSPVYEADGRVVGIAVGQDPVQTSWTAIQSVTDICFLLHLA